MDRDRYTVSTYGPSLALLIAMGVAHVRTCWSYEPDDTVVNCAYVRKLSLGSGLSLNGKWVNGFTSVSWGLLCSLMARLCPAPGILSKEKNLLIRFPVPAGLSPPTMHRRRSFTECL